VHLGSRLHLEAGKSLKVPGVRPCDCGEDGPRAGDERLDRLDPGDALDVPGKTPSISATRFGIMARVGLSIAAFASCAVETNCVPYWADRALRSGPSSMKPSSMTPSSTRDPSWRAYSSARVRSSAVMAPARTRISPTLWMELAGLGIGCVTTAYLTPSPPLACKWLKISPSATGFCPPSGTMMSAKRFEGSTNARCIGRTVS